MEQVACTDTLRAGTYLGGSVCANLPLLSQVDLERELEHKEALLARCMKREAEEVREALVYASDLE